MRNKEPNKKKLFKLVVILSAATLYLGFVACVIAAILTDHVSNRIIDIIFAVILGAIPTIGLIYIHGIPDRVVRDYCKQAEKEYQLHKDDTDSDRIYLSGEQMYKFLNGEVISIEGHYPFTIDSLIDDWKKEN